MCKQFDKMIWLSAIIVGLLFPGCLQISSPPKAVDGMLDLRQWSFKNDGVIPLSGQWRFYWDQLIPPQAFQSNGLQHNAKGIPSVLKNVPGIWNGTRIGDTKITGIGFATYHLTVLLPKGSSALSIKTLDAGTAFRAYVNGKPVAASGVPGENKETSRPQYLPGFSEFQVQKDRMELVVHISNFHHWQGGLWEPFLLGLPKDIHTGQKVQMAISFFLLGAIVIMGFYQLGLYTWQKKDNSSLYFSLINFLLALRMLVHGERYLVQMFPDIDYSTLTAMIYLSYYLCLPMFVLYTRSLFEEVSSFVVRVSVFTGLVFSSIVIVAPTRYDSYLLPVAQVLTMVVILYGVWVIGKAIWNKRQGARVFAFGFLIMAVAVVNDILYNHQVIFTTHLIPAGLMIFILTQAVLLSQRFTQAYAIVEKQSEQLASSNTAYKEELSNRIRMELELNASKERYQKLIQGSPDGICVIRHGKLLYANDRFIETTGVEPYEIENRDIKEFVHPDDWEKIDARYYLGMPPEDVGGAFNIRGIIRDGRVLDLELNGSIVQWEKKPAFMIFLRDVTEQTQTRKLLVQSEKMLSVGGLAAGMAHEINNPLAGMIQSAQLIKTRVSQGLDANEKIAEETGNTMTKIEAYMKKRGIIRLLNNSLTAGKNAAAIVDNMLSFAKTNTLEKGTGDLSKIVDKTLALIQNDFALKDQYDFKNIHIDKVSEADLKPALCEESKIQQVLLNLFKNAAQAMGQKEYQIDGPMISICLYHEGKMNCISVKDNGPGMEEGVRKRIFEPFYTTKDINSGTGLGLSISYFIVTEDHDGEMEALSEPGKGTEFIIRLPVYQGISEKADA